MVGAVSRRSSPPRRSRVAAVVQERDLTLGVDASGVLRLRVMSAAIVRVFYSNNCFVSPSPAAGAVAGKPDLTLPITHTGGGIEPTALTSIASPGVMQPELFIYRYTTEGLRVPLGQLSLKITTYVLPCLSM